MKLGPCGVLSMLRPSNIFDMSRWIRYAPNMSPPGHILNMEFRPGGVFGMLGILVLPVQDGGHITMMTITFGMDPILPVTISQPCIEVPENHK